MKNLIIPDVSVIVPIYNIENFLPACLNSLLAQYGVTFEIICINDGSTDKSGLIAADYANRHTGIRLVNIVNSGLSIARNTGLQHANGKYIFFIDGDDQITPNALSELILCAEANDVDSIFFNAQTIFDSPELKLQHTNTKHAGERTYNYSGVREGASFGIEQINNGDYTPAVPLGLYRKSYIDSLELKFIPHIIHEDNIFSYHIYKNIKKCIHFNKPIYKRLIRHGSITNSLSAAKSFLGYAVTHFEVLHAQNDASNANQSEFSKLIATNVYVHCMKILEEPENISACWSLVKQWHHLGQRLHMEALLYSAEHVASARSLGMQSATKGLMPNSATSGRAIVPTFGFIDAISHEPCQDGSCLNVVVEGWLLLWGCEVPDTLGLFSGSKNATLTQLNWHPREDVKMHHAAAKLQCGFKAAFEFDSTPTDPLRVVGLFGSCAESEPLFSPFKVSKGLQMLHLYECIYKDGQAASSDLVRPLRISNEQPYKRELQAYIRMFKEGLFQHTGHTGLFSPKFELKTKISFAQFLDFYGTNQASDVILINPFPQIKYWASNAWMQGELMHPGLVEIAQDLLCAAAIDLDVNTQDRHSDDYLCFCNFWVAREWVWESFVGQVLVVLNNFVDAHPEHPAVRAAHVGTQHTSEACFLPFMTERLFSSWLFANRSKLKVASFKPTFVQIKSLYCFNDFERDLVEKTHRWVDELDARDGLLTADDLQKLHQACHEYAVFTNEYYSKHPHPHG